MQSGIAVTAAALLPADLPPASPPGSATRHWRPGLFVFDERFPQAVEAALNALREGVRPVSTRQVFTGLWYEELDLGWRRAPAIVAGVTTERTLHVFETLALDRGMRVLDRAAVGGNGLARWTLGPAPRRRAVAFATGA